MFTSTAEAVLKPYMKSTIAIVVNQTEAKALPPENRKDLLIPGYPASKLEAEEIVLKANGQHLDNGTSKTNSHSLQRILQDQIKF